MNWWLKAPSRPPDPCLRFNLSVSVPECFHPSACLYLHLAWVMNAIKIKHLTLVRSVFVASLHADSFSVERFTQSNKKRLKWRSGFGLKDLCFDGCIRGFADPSIHPIWLCHPTFFSITVVLVGTLSFVWHCLKNPTQDLTGSGKTAQYTQISQNIKTTCPIFQVLDNLLTRDPKTYNTNQKLVQGANVYFSFKLIQFK